MESIRCIVHYNIKGCKYSNIKSISDVNKQRIEAAKSLRQKLDGANGHPEQCNSIPDEIDADKHGIHLEPCYKKFVHILSDKKFSIESGCTSGESSNQPRLKRRKLSDDTDSRGVFPKECNFCKKYRVKRKQNHHTPVTIITDLASDTIKRAAEAKEDKTLFYEIKDMDLIAKEFKYHDFCYRDYTRKEKVCAGSEAQGVDEDEGRLYGDFDAVVKCIQEKILCENQAVSMTILHDVYGLRPGDKRYRGKLKSRMQTAFGNQLYFISVDPKTPEVVINANVISSHTLFNDRNHVIEQAALHLRDDIISFAKGTPELSWPIDLKELTSEDRQPPPSVQTFLRNLLKSGDGSNSENTNRLVNSYSEDLVHGVTHGKFITAKHFLLGLGLHNITGQKKPIEITNHLGHCIDYNLVCEIETAQAEKAIAMANLSGILPLKPASPTSTVLTFFWVDNFDMNIETQTGHGSIHSTHMIAFQEKSSVTVSPEFQIKFQRKKNRVLNFQQTQPENVVVNPSKEPPPFPSSPVEESTVNKLTFSLKYFLWVVFRQLNSPDQTVSNYSGWCTQVRRYHLVMPLEKTAVQYLPPIQSKVTDFSTIFQYLKYLQKLSAEANMPYVNVTLDVGAAMNAYKLIWNYPDEFSNVLIHLGDFHFLKENFTVIGKIIKGSGFEDVIFQANACSTGSLNGVLSGSHYNRSWTVHSAFSEALERLLLERFLFESRMEIPDAYIEESMNSDCIEAGTFQIDDGLFKKYQEFKEAVRQGDFGITAKFWLCLYLDLMEIQHLVHQAVQENNFELRILCWKFFLPLYFSLDMTNYARYGSFYVDLLQRISIMYPGLKELLKVNGMSVQAQTNYPIRVAIDQRGEQTLNRDAKTTGGIKSFASSSTGILKWTLNRAEQAENTDALLSLAQLKTSSNKYKPLRPSQILKSEELVRSITEVLKEEYLNPFDKDIDRNQLLHLTSGIPVPFEIAEGIMELNIIGSEAYNTFKIERLDSNKVGIHTPITRMNVKLFKSCSRHVTVRFTGQAKSIEANRNIIGNLLAISAKSQQAIDFDAALSYPLCPVPLSLANADGSKRTTAKSKLQKIILSHHKKPLTHPRDNQPAKSVVSAYIVDLMAAIRCITEIPETYEDLTWKFLRTLPSGYARIDIVADTYQEYSIKSNERIKRGTSERIAVQSAKSKVPRNFSDFLKNGENKQKLIDLMLMTISNNGERVLKMLHCTELYFSTHNHCTKLNLSGATTEESLTSNQEEADTKVLLHSCHALDKNPNKVVVIRSPSADVDILVILLSKVSKQGQVYLDFGTGLHRKGVLLSDIDLPDDQKKCLIGFHAFTGNDYVSAFFRKGKVACWNAVIKNERFISTFIKLGDSWNVDEQLMNTIEEYVCNLYGCQQNDVNKSRKQLFDKKFLRQNKAIDISLLPPCRSSLRLHTLRSNAVARIWTFADERNIVQPDFSEHGWESNLEIKWIETAFPTAVEKMLVQTSDDLASNDEEESDDDCDINY